jgi:hypothetical protein
MGSPLITPQLKVPVLSFVTGEKGGPTNPSLDTTKFDSLGNAKGDLAPIGPRGVNQPLDVMTPEDKAKVADAQEKRLQAGMSSTAKVDSVGNAKGEFHVTPQGHDKHGARIPDKVDYTKPVETQPMVGPRGKGAQPDTYHGPKPTQS